MKPAQVARRGPSVATARRGHQPDYVLAIVIFILIAVGLVMMYSISPMLSIKAGDKLGRNHYFYNHLLTIGLGVVGWVVASNVDYRHWKRYAPALLTLAIICLVALVIPGISTTKNGATRWLALGPLSFQPSELLKLAMIVYLATWLQQRGDAIKSFWDGFVPFIVMLGAAAIAVVLFQRNLSTMIVLTMAAVSMYFVAGAPWRHLAALIGGILAAGYLAIITFPHRMARLTTFLNPEKATDAAGYHINQALIAVGSGGLFGLGLGKSIQAHGYLPEVINDSIFAIIAEEFGIIGAAVVLVLFAVLIVRGFQVAKSAPDTFARLLATGISVWLFVQSLVNIGAMLQVVPLTGIPLPFVSYGGSSMVISLVGAGILINISKYTSEVANATDRSRRRNSWAHNPSLGRARGPQATRP